MNIGKVKFLMGYLYILQSEKNSRYYIGSSVDLEKRFWEHNNGYVKATKYIRPLKIKFFKKFDTIKEARQIEVKLKRLKSKVIIEQIVKEQVLKMGL